MEKALWNGQVILACEVANDYDLENQIRIASTNKELRCPDPLCKRSILRYCHGEKKVPYFAHMNNDVCDYANYDKQNTSIIRSIKAKIYQNFKSRGYAVSLEEKLLPHHYTHLVVEMEDNHKIAIEFGTNRTKRTTIEELKRQYADIGVSVKWLVIGDLEYIRSERNTYTLKRYLLNESLNQDVIVIGENGETALQYKEDHAIYEYRGEPQHSKNYPKIYPEEKNVNDIILENGELSFQGFQERYKHWLKKKRRKFDEKIQQMEHDEQERQEQRRKQLLLEQQRREERMQEAKIREEQRRRENSSPLIMTMYEWQQEQQEKKQRNSRSMQRENRKSQTCEELTPGKKSGKETEDRMENSTVYLNAENMKFIYQGMIRCEICGHIGPESDFVYYRRKEGIGECRNCSMKRR